MYFQDVTSLLNMGGHGLYVWPTYGIGLLVIAYNVLAPLWHRKRVISQIKRQIQDVRRRGVE